MSAIERLPVRVRNRWVIVEIDSNRMQCVVTVHPRYRAIRSGGSTAYFVNGYGETSITRAAEYAREYGYTFATRAKAEAWASGEEEWES
jgi:hypothetical protein